MKILNLILIVTVLLLNVRLTRADDAAISPFVNDQTVVVVRFDLKTLDPAAVLQSCGKILAENGDDAQRVALTQDVWRQRNDNAQKLIKGLEKAGATQLYWILSVSDMTKNLDLPSMLSGTGRGVWVVPTDGAADRAAIERFITAEPNNAGKPVLEAQEISNAVVAAKPGRAIEHDGAALTAEWAKVLSPDAPIVIASVPGQVLRRSLEENLPTIQTKNGLLQVTQFTCGARSISISLKTTTPFAASATLECADASVATAIAKTINELTAPLKGKPVHILFDTPLSPITNAPELFACKAEGSQIRCTPDVNATIMPMVVQQMHDSLTVRAQGNMRQILLASIMYANQHRAFPANLDELVKEQELSPHVMEDPFQPGVKDAWVYIKPTSAVTNSKTAVLYEKSEMGMLVGFADGHVETRPNRASVMDAIGNTKKLMN